MKTVKSMDIMWLHTMTLMLKSKVDFVEIAGYSVSKPVIFVFDDLQR